MRYLPIFLLLFSTPALAADQTAASCSLADVETAITTCISTGGGTVTIPACAETAWGNDPIGIAIDTDTPLKILGAGKDVTNFSYLGNKMFEIEGNGVSEIGGWTVDLKNDGVNALSLADPARTTAILVHDIEALNSSAAPFKICHSDNAPIVMYNLEITDPNTYGIYVYGPSHLASYTVPETDWGVNNPNAVFIEDSVFLRTGGHVISGFTGSNFVARNNTFDATEDTGLDGHAWGYGQSCGQLNTDPRLHANNWGAYQFEIYDNTWQNTTATYCMRIRSGTGMVTDNVCDANETIRLAIESGFNSGYDPDEVTGTDTNVYTAIEPHIAAAANRPITGGSWATYWTLAGSTGGTWNSGDTYYPFFSDQSNCRVSVDFTEFWSVIEDDTEIYFVNGASDCTAAGVPYSCCTGSGTWSGSSPCINGSIGKLIKAPAAYNIPHQWWIWDNTSSGSVYAEEDGPGCLAEGTTYWLRAPQAGDPVENYTKYPYPHPLRNQGRRRMIIN